VTPELVGIAAGCAISLAAVDVVYVARHRISAVYLLDAATELALVVGLAVSHGAPAELPASDQGRGSGQG
jgi:hypothetical protein